MGADCLLAYSERFGWWNHGQDFNDSLQLVSMNSCELRVDEIRVWLRWITVAFKTLQIVSSIQMRVGGQWMPRYGEMGEGPFIWHVPPGEKIDRVWVGYGGGIDALQFFTDKGSSRRFGGILYESTKTVMLEGQLVGLYGRINDVLEQVGFISISPHRPGIGKLRRSRL